MSEQKVLDAINLAMLKERITELLNEMIDIAQAQKNWCGIAVALDFAAAYQIGKPSYISNKVKVGYRRFWPSWAVKRKAIN